MAAIKLKVSIPSFHEIAQKLEEAGQKLTDENNITLTKDTALERPIDWRLLTVRKDCVIEAAKVYKTPVNEKDYEVNNSQDFLNFVEDIYQYILDGTKPEAKPATPAKSKPKKPTVVESGWGKGT